jgi:single-strand DNA-binding protein
MKGDLLKMTNHITILGRVTKQVDVRYTPSSKVVCSFTLAVDRPFLNQEGKREADFIPVVVWGKAAELCGNSLAKGHRILVEGRLQIRNFDAKDGTKHWVTEVIASNVEFIEKKSESKQPTNMAQMGQEVPFDENVPF